MSRPRYGYLLFLYFEPLGRWSNQILAIVKRVGLNSVGKIVSRPWGLIFYFIALQYFSLHIIVSLVDDSVHVGSDPSIRKWRTLSVVSFTFFSLVHELVLTWSWIFVLAGLTFFEPFFFVLWPVNDGFVFLNESGVKMILARTIALPYIYFTVNDEWLDILSVLRIAQDYPDHLLITLDNGVDFPGIILLSQFIEIIFLLF